MANPTMPLLAEAAAEALGGTVDAGTGVKHQAFLDDHTSTPSAFSKLMNHANNLLGLLAAAAQGMVIDLDSGLDVGAYAMEYSIAGVAKSFPGSASYTLPASETCYIYLDTAATLKHLTTGWPSADHVKLAIATTDATTVTGVVDHRWENLQVGVVNNWWNFPAQGAVDLTGSDLTKVGRFSLEEATGATLTLDAAGAITPTQADHQVDTYAAASTDDLVDISLVSDTGDHFLILKAANAARTVVVKHVPGTLILLDGDFALDDLDKRIMLFSSANGPALWYELTRNRNTLQILQAALDANGQNITNLGTLNFTSTELTIAAGVVTKTGTMHTVDTESDAASDDLDTVSGGADGDWLEIAGESPVARNVTVKHNTGNIFLTHGNFLIDTAEKVIWLRYFGSLSKWLEMSRSYYSIADLAGTANAIPYTWPVTLDGALAIKVYERNIYCPIAFTIKDVTGIVNTAPSGGACIIDVRINGSSIFVSQAEMVNIADGQTQDTSAAKNHAVSAGDIITVEVELASSAADATLMINGYIAPQVPPS